MLSTLVPVMLGARVMRRTMPDAGACMATDMKPSGSAIVCPRMTSWPSRTTGFAGFPKCWLSGTISTGANGNWRISRSAVSSFISGGCTPCLKVFLRNRSSILRDRHPYFIHRA